MNNDEIINRAKSYFENHVPVSRNRDRYFAHVQGVCEYGLMLSKKLSADSTVVEVAAYLHDIGADAGKIHNQKSAEMTEDFLSKLSIDHELKTKILSAVRNHSMRQDEDNFLEEVSLEDQIIRDADGLSFLQNGVLGYFQKGIELYDDRQQAKEEAIDKVNRMYEKITTNYGRELAKSLKEKALFKLENVVKDQCFGVIPVRKTETGFEYLLVCHTEGHWAFPKGHPEKNESEVETALRELEEETGIKNCTIDPKMYWLERYQIEKEGIFLDKTVKYFLGWVSAAEIHIKAGEIQDYKWANAKSVLETITHDEAKKILQDVIKVVKTK